ncbi:MAG: hypothetical protein QXS81_01080 [Candidatus Micrarchaeaceae archaeon]
MTIRITKGELENVKYCIKGLLHNLQSDSVDLNYITEKLDAIKHTAENVAKAQAQAEEEASKRLDAEVDEMRDITERPDWEEGHEHRDIRRYRAEGLNERLKS